jgi:hypothetical protein
MKYIQILLMLAMLVSFTGCASLMGHSFSCPSDIKQECLQARSDAKAAIESKGTKVGKEYNCSIVKRPGEKKFGKMWCWTDPRWPGNYIGGCCGRGRIELGCNPQTMGEVWYEVEKHEFGHYWLIPIDTISHNPLYKDCFVNWYDPKGRLFFMSSNIKDIEFTRELLKEECDKVKEGELIGFDFADENGETIHIDFVGTGK